MWIELFDEVVEPLVSILKTFARLEICYQAHYGAISAVPEERISL